MGYQNNFINLNFNPAPSTVMHIDLNSCFATIEQQANPLLRGKPIAVAAYASPNGCILAPSVEAKRFGVKTGMRVKDGKALCSSLLVLPPDPWKYRIVHLKMRKIFKTYTNDFAPKSIDEFVLQLKGYPALDKGMQKVGVEIKQRIKREIGEWLTVSIGIAPNRYLAKVGAGLHKPDGLDEINKDNYLSIYKNLELVDLCGIKERNAARLSTMNIFTVKDLYDSPVWRVKAAFHSIAGYYWYCRLRGYEIDDVLFARRSYGNSYSLPKPFSTPSELSPILAKLVEKMGFRMRKAGYQANGIHLAIMYRGGGFWHKGRSLEKILFDSRDIFKEAYKLLLLSPHHSPVANLAVSCFGLRPMENIQLELFDDIIRRKNTVTAVDKINKHWGNFVITTARMAETKDYVPDRIAFGNVKELEEFTQSA